MPPVISATVTSWPASAAVRATASPTTPAPITRTCIAFPPSCHFEACFARPLNDYIKSEAGEGNVSMVNNVVRVCAQSDIAPETVRAFEVGDKKLAVFNLGGKFYVTDDEC